MFDEEILELCISYKKISCRSRICLPVLRSETSAHSFGIHMILRKPFVSCLLEDVWRVTRNVAGVQLCEPQKRGGQEGHEDGKMEAGGRRLLPHGPCGHTVLITTRPPIFSSWKEPKYSPRGYTRELNAIRYRSQDYYSKPKATKSAKGPPSLPTRRSEIHIADRESYISII